MTKRLALMLAIAIVLLVNTTIGEGGALDNIASNDAAQLAAVDSDEAVERGDDSSTLAVATTSPWAVSNTSSRNGGSAPIIGTWGEENEAETSVPPIADEPRRAPRSEPRASARTGGATPEGALERHRMNIEE
jgi:hypothetical protein